MHLQVHVPRFVRPRNVVHHDDVDKLVQSGKDQRLHRHHLCQHVGRLGQDHFGLALLRHLHVDAHRAGRAAGPRLHSLNQENQKTFTINPLY